MKTTYLLLFIVLLRTFSYAQDYIGNAEDMYYHPSQIQYNGILCAEFNHDWIKILVITQQDIKEYDSSKMAEDMVTSIRRDFNNDGKIEQIITGTFMKSDKTEGSFITVIDEHNNILLTSVVADEPRLVHLRDVNDSVFYGTKYFTEYFRQISWNNGYFESTYIESDEM